MEGNWYVYFCVKNREVAYSYFNIDIDPPPCAWPFSPEPGLLVCEMLAHNH